MRGTGRTGTLTGRRPLSRPASTPVPSRVDRRRPARHRAVGQPATRRRGHPVLALKGKVSRCQRPMAPRPYTRVSRCGPQPRSARCWYWLWAPSRGATGMLLRGRRACCWIERTVTTRLENNRFSFVTAPARRFFEYFLAGYRRALSIDTSELLHIPHFLKIPDLGLNILLRRFVPDGELDNSWSRDIMATATSGLRRMFRCWRSVLFER